MEVVTWRPITVVVDCCCHVYTLHLVATFDRSRLRFASLHVATHTLYIHALISHYILFPLHSADFRLVVPFITARYLPFHVFTFTLRWAFALGRSTPTILPALTHLHRLRRLHTVQPVPLVCLFVPSTYVRLIYVDFTCCYLVRYHVTVTDLPFSSPSMVTVTLFYYALRCYCLCEPVHRPHRRPSTFTTTFLQSLISVACYLPALFGVMPTVHRYVPHLHTTPVTRCHTAPHTLHVTLRCR